MDKLSENCGYHNNHKNCCMDIYQRLGQSKSPSLIIGVLLAFLIPIIIFISVLILSELFLLSFMHDGNLKTFFSFITALIVTILSIEFIKPITRKPTDKK